MTRNVLRLLTTVVIAAAILAPAASAAPRRSASLQVTFAVGSAGVCTKTTSVTWDGYSVWAAVFETYVDDAAAPSWHDYVPAPSVKNTGTLSITSRLPASSGSAVVVHVTLLSRRDHLAEMDSPRLVVPPGCVYGSGS